MPSVILAGTTTGTALSLTGDTSGELQIQTNNGATTAMTLTTGGNVGIGTTTPAYPVDIVSNSGSAVGISLRGQATNIGIASFWSNDGVTRYSQIRSASDEFRVQAISAIPITLYTNNTERMRIDSSGKVGIGTSSPSAKLSIVSASSTANTISDWNNHSIILGPNAGSSTGSVMALGYNTTSNESEITSLNPLVAWRSLALFSGGMRFCANNGAESMRIDSSGNVGIGTSSPATKLVVKGTHVAGEGLINIIADSGTRYAALSLTNNTTQKGIIFHDNTDNMIDIYGAAGQGLRFTTNNTERMRIDSSGTLLVACTASPSSTNRGVSIGTNGPSGMQIAVANTLTAGFAGNIVFINGNGQVGSIDTSGTSTSYVTTSDYRLKENIAPMTGALARVSALKPVTYTWKADGTDGQGFIAHELKAVVPDAVSGEKDAVDDEGKPKYQGIDTSFLVATLTAAIQELKAELDSVKAELQTLKGA
jgi:hypothetical protein